MTQFSTLRFSLLWLDYLILQYPGPACIVKESLLIYVSNNCERKLLVEFILCICVNRQMCIKMVILQSCYYLIVILDN